jgi:hypothetical protein
VSGPRPTFVSDRLAGLAVARRTGGPWIRWRLGLNRPGFAGDFDPKDLDAQIQRIDMQIERAVDLAVELGDVDAVKVKLRSLREERSRLSADRVCTAGRIPTIEEFMPMVKAKLADLRTTLERDVAQSRMALGALLGEDRLRIYADGRIEGAAMLEPEMKLPAPSGSSKPGDTVVAGARSDRLHMAGK